MFDRTVFGRWVYAIGSNSNASRLSGVPVNWVRLVVFAVSGAMAGCAAVIAARRIPNSVRADAAQGTVLNVLTVVLLGSIILGGSGSLGAESSLILIGLIQNAMRLADISTTSPW